jgi:uncharacterized membrane protein HdeD (DUF308 family)
VLLTQRLAGIVSGVLSFVWPILIALTLPYIIDDWAVVTGVLEIVTEIRLQHEIDGEWLMGLANVMTVVVGLLVACSGSGAVELVWLIGAYAIAAAVVLIALGHGSRSLAAEPSERHSSSIATVSCSGATCHRLA